MTIYCASLSYGKDSMAMLHVVKDVLHKPLDRILTADIWATENIPAELPPMVDFKDKADRIILDRWGIKVEHLCATDKEGNKQTYEKLFYHMPKRRIQKNDGGVVSPNKSTTKFEGSQSYEEAGVQAILNEPHYKGWPLIKGPWCRKLKLNPLKKSKPLKEGR